MLNLKKLTLNDYISCNNLLISDLNDYNYFSSLGWKTDQIKLQICKSNNFALGLFEDSLLEAFIFGNLITIEKKIEYEYEILLLYVNTKKRKLGYASKLLENIEIILKKKKLKKIYLEVASNNVAAINLYKKNNFLKIDIRKKYYLLDDERIDAIIFEKIVNE